MLLPLLLAQVAPAVPDTVAQRFTPFDQDADGVLEIEQLVRVPCGTWTGHDDARRLVAILVEPRQLEPLDDAAGLGERIARLGADLEAEGYAAASWTVTFARGDGAHRDGRLVLALREVLRALDESERLEGALLVGRFPDAFLVRTCNWRKRGNVRLHRGTPDDVTHEDVRFVRRVPEDVAHRADIVLADLDGRWEDVYVESRSRLPRTVAVFGGSIPRAGGDCLDVEVGHGAFVDFFHVSDGKLELRERVGAGGEPPLPAVFLDDRSGDHECAAADRERPNVLARPDVLVSRIDARGVALRPRSEIRGTDGAGLVDESGRPRTVAFASKDAVPHWRDALWEHDPSLERRLMEEFLDRNHAYRTGRASIAWRPASIAHDLGSGYASMARAAEDWDAGDAALSDVRGRPDLATFARWMAYPAVLRTVRAHSDPWGSVFAKADLTALEAAAGPQLWSWRRRGATLEPSLAAACGGGKQDWFLLRTLWANGRVATEPCFYLHTGCHGISPPGAKSLAFDHPSYGRRQGAEALLFFGSGLALVGRAKVFYDEPKGFAARLRDGATIGAAWANYFDVESRAATWSAAGGDIGRKRSYFWSVLGDWTLRLARGEAPVTGSRSTDRR